MYIPDIRAREIMQKESYVAQRASRHKLENNNTVVLSPPRTSSSLDSLHDRPTSMRPPARLADDMGNNAYDDDDDDEDDDDDDENREYDNKDTNTQAHATSPPPSRPNAPPPPSRRRNKKTKPTSSHSWLKTYWHSLLDQRFKDPAREAAFQQYFTHALQLQTRLSYIWAFVSAAASTLALIAMYGLPTARETPAFTHIALVLPSISLVAFASTFLPTITTRNPQYQQSLTLAIYTLLAALSLYSSTIIIPHVQASNAALDAYIAVSNFRLNLMMARASAPTLRGRYALAAAVGVDAVMVLVMFAQAGQLARGLNGATLMFSVAAIGGLAIAPWGEKAHRRYCRTVVWNEAVGGGGFGGSSLMWAPPPRTNKVDTGAAPTGCVVDGATRSELTGGGGVGGGVCVRSAELEDVL
ncbi:hypothetical protein HDU86_000047 [Geranomyces michiganensis]|nr:hypothetical protein HDU86_000047 [Geranomyces michiganensis]